MKSIIFVSYTAGRGGASKVMSLLMNDYARSGWNVTYVVRDVFQAYPLDSRINTIQLGENPKFSHVFFLKWLRKYIKENKPNIAVSFLVVPNVITLLAAAGTSTKVIISERNDPRTYSHIYKMLIRLIYPLADRMVFQTERAKSYYSKQMQKKGVIIRNPISVNAFAVKPNKKIVSAGRLEPQKNQKMLISAFSQLVKDYPEYKLYIYGEGALRGELEAQVRELDLQESVFLPGNVTDIHERFSDAEFFVLPSNFEGLSNMLLEAMMMGLPCISTNCAGSDEVITDHTNGILIPVGGQDELLHAMQEVVENANLRNRLAQNAKASANEYVVPIVIKKWRAVIGENRDGE